MMDSDVAIMRREMDRIQQDRIVHLESRIEDLTERVDRALRDLDLHLDDRMEKTESLIADKAATIAVRRAFAHIGVDVDDPADMQRFRDDLRFGGVFRDAATKGFFAIVAAICGGLGLSLWLVLKEKAGIP